jgi:alpha-tubulin suppressor-like RCC1 family protein
VDLAALSLKSFAGKKIADVAMGNGFACARFEDGEVSCWGDNSEGQWGVADDGTNKDGTGGGGTTVGGGPVDLGAGRKALGIAASSASVAVVLDNGSVRQWGRFGILQIPKPTTYAFGPCAVPDEYPCQGYAPAANDKVEAISGGFGHFCGRLSDGRVACWKKKPEASPNALSEGEAALAASASSAFDKPADPALARPGEDPRRDVGTARAIVTSDGHTCAVLQSGGLRCWGQNDSGQLGIGSSLKIDGKGDNALLNVPVVTLGAGRTVLRVALGGKHTCALLDDRSLKCWGKNDAEQRGDSDPTNRGDTALSTPDLLRPIAFP